MRSDSSARRSSACCNGGDEFDHDLVGRLLAGDAGGGAADQAEGLGPLGKDNVARASSAAAPISRPSATR